MSFSSSRKAALQARMSGDASCLYSLQDHQISEAFLWQQSSEPDLSLNLPSRPERLVITDDESIDRYYVAEEHGLESSGCEEDLEKYAGPTLIPHPPHEGHLLPPRQPCEVLSRSREIAILATICMVQIIPLSALGTSFPTAEIIAASFKITDPSILPWTVAAYALTFGTFILMAGQLGDIFGHKRMVISGFVIMSLASILAGLSIYSTYVLHFVARALQGLGSAFMQPNGLALLGGMYPPNTKKKNYAFALFGAMAAPGAYMGMLFGAMLARNPTWTWASYALAIAAGICGLLAQLVLISQPRAQWNYDLFSTKIQAMDWGGAVTGVTGLTCIAIAWVQAPSLGWRTPYIYVLFILGVISMAAFVLVEIKVATNPLVPFKTLKADVVFILTAVGLGWASFGIWIFYLWQFLLHSRQLSPMAVAIQVAPVVPMGFIANGITGVLMNTAKPFLILCFSLFAFTTAAVLIAVSPVTQSYWSLTFISILIIPFGMDMSFPATTITISNTLPPHQQGIASSLIATVVNYSMTLGLAFASTVQHYVGNNGRDMIEGYRGAFYMSIGLGGLGTFIATTFFIKDLLRERQTHHQASDGPSVGRRKSRLCSQTTLTPSRSDLFTLAKTPDTVARSRNEPLSGQTTEVPSGRISTDALWEQHSAVRSLVGAELIAKD